MRDQYGLSASARYCSIDSVRWRSISGSPRASAAAEEGRGFSAITRVRSRCNREAGVLRTASSPASRPWTLSCGVRKSGK